MWSIRLVTGSLGQSNKHQNAQGLEDSPIFTLETCTWTFRSQLCQRGDLPISCSCCSPDFGLMRGRWDPKTSSVSEANLGHFQRLKHRGWIFGGNISGSLFLAATWTWRCHRRVNLCYNLMYVIVRPSPKKITPRWNPASALYLYMCGRCLKWVVFVTVAEERCLGEPTIWRWVERPTHLWKGLFVTLDASHTSQVWYRKFYRLGNWP